MKTIKSAIAALEKAKTLKGPAQKAAIEGVIRKLLRALTNASGEGPDDQILP